MDADEFAPESAATPGPAPAPPTPVPAPASPAPAPPEAQPVFEPLAMPAPTAPSVDPGTVQLPMPVPLPAPMLAPIPTKKPFPLTRVLIAGGAVLSIAVGAGVGGVIVQHRDDRNNQAVAAAEALTAAKPKPITAGVRADGTHYGPLYAFLLPIPTNDTAGPDVTVYGNNSFVSADQISSGIDDLLSSIPKSDLSNAKGRLAGQHLKGVAVRSLSNSAWTESVSIVLRQLDPKDATSDANAFVTLFTDLNVFRTGPNVPGYPQARCMLPPGLGSDKLDSMECVAVSGDIELFVNADGTAPLDQNAVAQLVAQQLDRLKSPQTLS